MRFTQNASLKFLFPLVVFLNFSLEAFTQKVSPQPAYKLLRGANHVQSKNYYLLTLFQELADVKKLLAADASLAMIATIKSDSLQAALKNCGRDGRCFIERMKFTEAEIKVVGERLATLYQPGNSLGKLVQDHLIPSGTYILFDDLPAKEMLVKAWEQDAAGINFSIDVYAGGSRPNYPLIDSISFTTKDPRNNTNYLPNYVSLLYNATSVVALESASQPEFYFTPLTFALRFLEMNERGQAADFEPMEQGENKLAFAQIKATRWTDFKYTVILVPGAGPSHPEVALSAEAMVRCRLAAIQFKKGLAPFIMVSGGKVHPYKTKFCEATEMKQYLVEKLKIPARAILIDPHARHTTTNMRNAARIMYRYGIPFNKAGITCTTKGQSNMIATTLAARCQKELNEIPFRNGERLTETEVEFFPLVEALQINPKEPMDP